MRQLDTTEQRLLSSKTRFDDSANEGCELEDRKHVEYPCRESYPMDRGDRMAALGPLGLGDTAKIEHEMGLEPSDVPNSRALISA